MPKKPRTTSWKPRSSRYAVSAPLSAGCSQARELIPVRVTRCRTGWLSSVIENLPCWSSCVLPGVEAAQQREAGDERADEGGEPGRDHRREPVVRDAQDERAEDHPG